VDYKIPTLSEAYEALNNPCSISDRPLFSLSRMGVTSLSFLLYHTRFLYTVQSFKALLALLVFASTVSFSFNVL
jgi:hypothetical protein